MTVVKTRKELLDSFMYAVFAWRESQNDKALEEWFDYAFNVVEEQIKKDIIKMQAEVKACFNAGCLFCNKNKPTLYCKIEENKS